MKNLKLKNGRFLMPYAFCIIALQFANSLFSVKAQTLENGITLQDIKAAFPELANKLSSGEKLEIKYHSGTPELDGKIKAVGDVQIDYYRGFYPEINGKLKAVDNIVFDYYTSNFYPEIKGKLKSIGGYEITYYTGNFYPEIKGKVKSIGNTEITYFTGDFYPEIKGKVKTIGNATITYHTGDFYPNLKGRLKSIDGRITNKLVFLFDELVDL